MRTFPASTCSLHSNPLRILRRVITVTLLKEAGCISFLRFFSSSSDTICSRQSNAKLLDTDPVMAATVDDKHRLRGQTKLNTNPWDRTRPMTSNRSLLRYLEKNIFVYDISATTLLQILHTNAFLNVLINYKIKH